MNTLTPLEQRDVEFYDDRITAVRTDSGVFVPVKPICDLLGVDWNGQRRRINRDAVLSEEKRTVDVTSIEGNRQVTRSVICLPLDLVSGFLFGLNADRVRADLKEKVIRYQRECYSVLAEAFQEGRLTSDPTFEALLQQDNEDVQAYKMLQALVTLARNQIIMRGQLEAQEAQIQAHSTELTNHANRLETIEATLGDSGRNVTPEQASQISQAVKTVAMVLSKASGSNQYGAVYGELYRRFGITSYKLLPAHRFEEAMQFMTEWHQSLVGDSPF